MDQDGQDFDVAIIGTGITESILAAALAGAGKRVLQMEPGPFYGGPCASLKASDFIAAVKSLSSHSIKTSWTPPQQAEPEKTAQEALDQPTNDTQLAEAQMAQLATLVAAHPHIVDHLETICGVSADSIGNVEWALAHQDLVAQALHLATILAKSRHFNLELHSILLYASGPLVELLASSRVGPSLEFKMLEDFFFEWASDLEKVPSGKDDIFSSKSTDLLSKRRLMKFISLALEYEANESAWKDFRDLPFVDFLASQKLDAKATAVIINAIALVGDADAIASLTTQRGLELTHLHLRSLGRYGKRGFLMGIYGTCSELSQAFSRFCAVFGGVTTLDLEVGKISRYQQDGVDRFSIPCGEHRFTASIVIAGAAHATLLPVSTSISKSYKWRAVSISNAPLLGDGSLAVAVLPPTPGESRKHAIYAIQNTAETSTCPPGFYVTSFVSDAPSTSEEDLAAAIKSLQKYQESKQHGLTTLDLFYRLERVHAESTNGWLSNSIAIVDYPTGEMLCEGTLAEARRLFDQICPGEDFIPASLSTTVGIDDD